MSHLTRQRSTDNRVRKLKLTLTSVSCLLAFKIRLWRNLWNGLLWFINVAQTEKNVKLFLRKILVLYLTYWVLSYISLNVNVKCTRNKGLRTSSRRLYSTWLVHQALPPCNIIHLWWWVRLFLLYFKFFLLPLYYLPVALISHIFLLRTVVIIFYCCKWHYIRCKIMSESCPIILTGRLFFRVKLGYKIPNCLIQRLYRSKTAGK